MLCFDDIVSEENNESADDEICAAGLDLDDGRCWQCSEVVESCICCRMCRNAPEDCECWIEEFFRA